MNRDVVESVASFLGISVEELLERHDNHLQYQLERWHQLSSIDATTLADFYNDNLYLYELVSTPRFGLVRLIEPFLQPGSVILDYGSGIGTHGLYFLGRGHHVTFVDLPSPHFDYIRWEAARANLAATLVEKSAADTLPEGSFDAVLCFDVLEHVLDWRETIQHFSRLLKPEGRLFLIVSFREYEEHALHIFSHTGLTEDSFQECIRQNGLVEIFHRNHPVPLSHPAESFKVFAHAPDERVSRVAALFEAGEAHLHKGSLWEAERCFTDVIAWNPHDFSAHRALARVFLGQGKLAEAAAEVERTLELLPEDYDALELSADIHMKSGRQSDAAKRYVEAIALRPEQSAHARRMLAALLEKGESFELLCSPIDDWRKLLALLGYLIEIRNVPSAEKLAGRLTATHPPETYAGYMLWKEYARLLRETRRSAKAVDVLERLIPHHPHRPWLHFDLSLCHSAAGNYAAALAELDREEASSPFHSAIHFERGMIWRTQGDLTKAMAAFAKAAELAPENGAAFLERARTALLMGDRAAALPDLKQAAALMPDDAQVHWELGRLEVSLRHFRDAIKNFDAYDRLAPDQMQFRQWIVAKLSRAVRRLLPRSGR